MRHGLVLCLIVGTLAFPLTPTATADPPPVDPRAERLIQKMAAYLAGLKNFAVDVTTYQDVYDAALGQMIEYGDTQHVVVQRPDRMATRTLGDRRERSTWFDGKQLTLYDRRHRVYAQRAQPGTIDDLIRTMRRRYSHPIPLSDLLQTDVTKALMADVQRGSHVGLHRAMRRPCHHLAFTQETIDWQIWIDAGEQPLPRKLVVTHKLEDGVPQYRLLLRWDLSPKLDAKTFVPDIPEGTERIEIRPIGAPAAKPAAEAPKAPAAKGGSR